MPPMPNLARRIDHLCDQFEADWIADKSPDLGRVVSAVDIGDQSAAFAALLAVELELRRNRGQSPTAEEYRRRFPQFESVIDGHFGSDQPTAAFGTPKTSAAPTKVGRFEIRGVLGAGAFGRVYRAFDPQLGREVAVKVPLADAMRSADERERFLREANAAAKISHPNVCPIHEVGEHDGRPFIVMALVPGQTLAAVLQNRPQQMPPKQAALVVRKIALGLEAAHKKGVVHRDLKPSNIMFDRERKDIVVMDFGLARGPRPADAKATQSGMVLGTPAYMSPEQARGDSKAVGPEADVFALGVILYEMLTGKRPFTGTAAEVIGQILHVEPDPPSASNPAIDAKLDAICRRALAKVPAERFGSMREFVTAIEGWMKREAGPASDTAGPTRTRSDAAATAATMNTAQQLAEVFAVIGNEHREETAAAVEMAVRKARTPRWVYALLAAIPVVAVVALAVILSWRPQTVKVTLQLPGIDLYNREFSFFLDGASIAGEELADEIKLTPGRHELLVKRGDVVVRHLILTVKGGRNPSVETDDVTPKPPPPPSEWTPLFNGRELSEWQVRTGRPSQWKLEKGDFVGTATPRVTSIFHQRRLRDFIVRLEFRFDDFMGRAALLLQPPWDEAIEIELRPEFDLTAAERAQRETTGNIGWRGAPANGLQRVDRLARMAKKGEWNRLELTVAGAVATVAVNDVVIADLDVDDLTPIRDELTAADGSGVAVGLQCSAASVRFRGIEFKKTAPLPGRTDRVLAERLLRKGLHLSVESKGKVTNVKTIAELPAKRFRVTNVNFHWNNQRGTDAILEDVARLTDITSLDIDTTDVTTRGIQTISALRTLKSLLVESAPINPAGMAHVANLVNLEMLGLAGSRIDGESMRHLNGMPRLWWLRVTGTAFDNEGLKWLKNCSGLRHLLVEGTRISDDGLVHLRDYPKLEVFFADRTRITDHGLPALAQCRTLSNLHLIKTQITDDGLKHLLEMPNLKSLEINENDITDTAVPTLSRFRNLKSLNVSKTKMTADGIKKLREALPNCKVAAAK